MKKLLIVCLTLFIASVSYAQNPNEFTMKIENIVIQDNGKEIKYDTTITAKIYLDVDNRILMYDNGTYKYYCFIKMARSGNRIKIVEQNYITDANNKFVVFGKQRKQVQFINVGMPGKFVNTSGEYLLIDKNSFTSMKVSYLRTIFYGNNQPQ
jgi:hypothetical protein